MQCSIKTEPVMVPVKCQIPQGYKAVAVRRAFAGEWILGDDKAISWGGVGRTESPYVILEPNKPRRWVVEEIAGDRNIPDGTLLVNGAISRFRIVREVEE